MRQLTYEETGRYAWREAPEPQITAPEQALVRPLAVACCDLDVAVCNGRLPLPPGYAVGHEGLAEVVAVGDDVKGVRVGDRVVVPFQISCGACRECRRGVTGSCSSVPLMATYGMAPIAGLDGGGFMSDLVLVPVRRRDAHPGSRRRRPRLHRVPVGQHSRRLARPSGRSSDGAGRARSRRSPRARGRAAVDRAVLGRVRRGAGRPRRLRRHRPAAAGRRREARRGGPRRRQTRQVVGPLPGHRAHHRRSGAAFGDTARDLAGRRVHRHRDLPRIQGRDAVAADVHPRRAIRHRTRQRAHGHPAGARIACRAAWTCRRPSTASSRGRTPPRPGRR